MSRLLGKTHDSDSESDEEETDSFLVGYGTRKQSCRRNCCCLACCLFILLVTLTVAGGVAALVVAFATDWLKDSSTAPESSTISMKVNTTVLVNSGDWLTLSWENVGSPSKLDWIGVYVPTSEGKIDALNHAPIKFQYANVSSTHMISGSGSLEIRLLNMRQDVIMGFFRKGLDTSKQIANFTDPVAVAVSEVVRFENPNEPLQGHLSLTTDPTEMMLVWVTKNSSEPTVKWGSASGNYTHEGKANSSTYTAEDLCGAPATDFGYIDPGMIHTALLNNLVPGQSYYYLFGEETCGWSEEFSFTAAPESGSDVTTRVIAYGDMGTTNQDGMLPVTEEQPLSLNTTNWILNRSSETDFVLHIGDISYALGYLTVWETFFSQIEPVATQLPYMVCIGNHERDWPNSGSFYNVDDSNGECGVPHERKFAMPRPSLDEPWYGFDYGKVHFLLMSTEHNFTQGSQQFMFLEKDLQNVNSSRTPWIVFAGHRPMYVYDAGNGTTNASNQPVAKLMRKHLEPLFKEYGVDVALWGHEHAYQRTCPIYQEKCNQNGTTHLIIGMAGRKLQGDKYYPMSQKPTWIHHFNHKNYGYLRLEANATTLSVSFVADDTGTVKDSVELQKSS